MALMPKQVQNDLDRHERARDALDWPSRKHGKNVHQHGNEEGTGANRRKRRKKRTNNQATPSQGSNIVHPRLTNRQTDGQTDRLDSQADERGWDYHTPLSDIMVQTK